MTENGAWCWRLVLAKCVFVFIFRRVAFRHPLVGGAEEIGEVEFDVLDGRLVQAGISPLERKPEGAEPYRNVRRHLESRGAVPGWVS